MPTTLKPACPRCGYDLQGQVATWHPGFREEEPYAGGEGAKCPLTGTCSECGFEAEWADVFSPLRRGERLFEVDELERFKAFRWTWLWSLMCWPLWNRLAMYHPISAVRLILFAVLSLACSYLAIAFAWFLWEVVTLSNWLPPAFLGVQLTWSGKFVTPLGVSLLNHWWGTATTPLWVSTSLLQWVLMPVTFFMLPISMRRAKVRRVHLVRGLLYSTGWLYVALSVPGFVSRIESWLEMQRPLGGTSVLFSERPWQVFVFAFGASTVWWAVVAGRYLKLPKAWLVGLVLTLLSSLVSFLVIALLGWWDDYAYDMI